MMDLPHAEKACHVVSRKLITKPVVDDFHTWPTDAPLRPLDVMSDIFEKEEEELRKAHETVQL
jgi:hypothetical protein